ncbi:SH3 domain-containing protein [Aquisalimonas asiatica]|uniref:SH3 domain-containing protein n=1 Tax=Aquisalimonas asiatica TaxID=406100 RepID=A0A1H8SKD1_9GAMM|nr:SH3 domain-containing protein [Aquisalimonas asiatica]SEO79027.1 SH3 domain-containing protein [Aquisalimonas asiatica]
MSVYRHAAWALLACAGLAAAAPGDMWEVQSYSSNFRSGPDTDYGVVTQGDRGDVVMELDRDGDWLLIAYNRGGSTAWAHESLVERLTVPVGEADDSPDFDGFASTFDPEDPENQFGAPAYFSNPAHKEFGVVRVDAVNGFFDLDDDIRESHLESLLRLWITADNSGLPGTLVVREADSGVARLIHSDYRGNHDLEAPDPPEE